MFSFKVVSESALADGSLALVLAVTNLPESSNYKATNKYNRSRKLPIDNQYKFKEANVDPVKLNESAENFLRQYGTQSGLGNELVVDLSEKGWTHSGYDTQQDLSIKIDAWITPVSATFSRLVATNYRYSNTSLSYLKD